MAEQWLTGDHADVGGMAVELLHREGGLWRCARIFPKADSPRTLLVDEALMVRPRIEGSTDGADRD